MMSRYLETSREPLRPVVDSPEALSQCLDALASARGPVAFDVERAHGHRYWPKAYLFQIRRRESGTWLIDPVAFENQQPADLSCLVTACGDATWLIHAASQDLPSMVAVGIVPPSLFDTELAARLLGIPSTGLAALLESKLDVMLRKAHSSANWSMRPLPESWLIYAALDVDYLIELSEALHADLAAVHRDHWAVQECNHVLRTFATVPSPRPDPWRRLSGITNLRRGHQLAVARELWLERDQIARNIDRPPGWILSDGAIVDLAATAVQGVEGNIDASRHFTTRSARRYRHHWIRALSRAAALKPSDYPPLRRPKQGIPHPRNWAKQYPAAWAGWTKVRAVVDQLAEELGIQASLIAPSSLLQEWVFHYREGQDIATELRNLGVRPWQLELLVPVLSTIQELN